MLPIAKNLGSGLVPIFLDQGRGPLPAYGGEDECNCCGEDCCVELEGGTYNASGYFEFQTTVLDIRVYMPNGASRVICQGEQVRIEWDLRSGYTSGGFTEHNLWATRDFLLVDQGEVSGDLLLYSDAGYAIWQNMDNAAYAVFQYNKCWHDYEGEYGDIQVGSNVGAPSSGEVTDITFTEQDISEETECCPYPYECEPCHWVFPYIGGSFGPEHTTEGVTYWDDGYGGTDWAMKAVVLSGWRDVEKKIMQHGDTFLWRVAVRPDKDHYRIWSTNTDVTFCADPTGYTPISGSEILPDNSTNALISAATCAGGTPPDCDFAIKTATYSKALMWTVETTIAECGDCDIAPNGVKIEFSANEQNGAGSIDLEVTGSYCDTEGEICCDSSSSSSSSESSESSSESISESSSESDSSSESVGDNCYCTCYVIQFSMSTGAGPDTFTPSAFPDPDTCDGTYDIWYHSSTKDTISSPDGTNYDEIVLGITYCTPQGSCDALDLYNQMLDWIDDCEADNPNYGGNVHLNAGGECSDSVYEDEMEPLETTPAGPSNSTTTVIIDKEQEYTC